MVVIQTGIVQEQKGEPMPKYIVEVESIEDLLDGYHSVPSELILCKDCVFSEGFGWSACPMLGIVKLKDDDFCSRGERRTDETD